MDPKHLQNHAYKATENCAWPERESFEVVHISLGTSDLFPESSTISLFLW